MGLSLKLAVVSATVLSTAVMFNFLAPIIMNFSIADVPAIWSALISWLKPPYLYVVLNCIIITIVASSRLQSKVGDSPPLSTFPTPPFEPAVKVVLPVEIPQFHQPEVPEVVPFHGVLVGSEPPVKEAVAGYTGDRNFVQVPEPDLSSDFREEDIKIATEAYEEITKHMANKSVISTSPSKISRVDLSFPVEKPPASARFSHRKPTKASPEGGKTLGVTKPKRQDTLETTWKTITEGRSVPLTRHLRKSDTWETQGRHNRNSSEAVDHHPERMTKSDTFDVNHGGGSMGKPPPPPSKLSRSGGSGRLKKEPSLGQEELNRRVEAFIKKFNEDMRLQRQESLNQYMEMINRGAH